MIQKTNKICCDQCCHKPVCKNKVYFKGIYESAEAAVNLNNFDGLRVNITCEHFLEEKENSVATAVFSSAVEKDYDLITLIRQKLQEDGCAGIIITVPKDGRVGPNRVDFIKTLDGADKAICGLYTSDEEREAHNESNDKN